MNNSGKHLITNLLKTGSIISFSLIIAAFIAACSTPTVSSDDFDGKFSSSEKIEKEGDLSSSSNTSNGKEVNGSSSSKKKAESSSSENQPELNNGFADEVESSSSSVTLATPCKTETEDNCEYGELKDSRDGQTYKTVKIGDQWWMAENLNFDPGQGGSDDAKYDWSWCYKDNADNCVKYGRLYTWAAAIDSVKLATDVENPLDCGYGKVCGLASADSATLIQGICPNGWHLPSETEWEKLFEVVGGQSTAGNVLKSQTGWESKNGTDAFGFSAVSAGHRNVFGAYNGNAAYFWGSTEANRYYACRMYLEYNYDNAALTRYDKFLGHSVRCVKD